MRVELPNPAAVTAPGATFELVLEVVNTSGVIDGVTARPVGLDPGWVRSRPSQLALFPDASGTITLEITLPHEYPAGLHELAIEVSSTADPSDVEYVAFSIEVAPVADVVLQLEPERLEGGRGGVVRTVVLNGGNTALELTLTAVDRDRVIGFQFDPPFVAVPPGASATSLLRLRTRRRWFGSPTDLTFEVEATGRQIEISAIGQFHHKPLVPRGVLTIGTLAAIVAAWALIFLLVLTQVLDDDPADKAAPPSYFATSEEAIEAGAGAGGAAGGGGAASGAQKLDLSAVAASITGTVTTPTTNAGVGRITVEAVRIARDGPVLESSAATDEEGFYSLTGLSPGTYAIHFVNPGFEDRWYPAATTREAGETVRVGAMETRDNIDSVVLGLPGSLTGLVDTGLDPGEVAATVSIRQLVGGVPGPEVASRSTGTTGAFTVVGLPTPASYEITATAPGYETTTVTEQLAGGEQRLAATVRLSAGAGSISGLVTSGGAPLGGVTITATAGELEITSATPTAGAVGRYVLADLPTPGTYLLTFAREGFGAETLAVDLGPGENRAGLDIELARGTGSISGTVRDSSGNALGDVEVVVNGGTTSVSTRTLTAGARGSWSVSGLQPGDYTITFALAGFSSETIAVRLPPNSAIRNADAVLATRLAALRGTVTDFNNPDTGLANVGITITDGTVVRQGVTASNPAGSYSVTDLTPGIYSVTFADLEGDYEPRTVLVELAPGQDRLLDVMLRPVSG